MRPAFAGACAALAFCASPASSFARGWEGVAGDGKATTEKRDVAEFDAIRLRTSLDADVKVGPQRSVTVRIDGNLQGLLTTKVEKGVLVISSEKSLRPAREARVEVTVPALRRFDLDGSGDVTIEGGAGALDLAAAGSGNLRWRGEASTLQVRVEGSGDVRLEGRAAVLRAGVEGSGAIEASKLEAVDVEARVEGSGDVVANVAGGKLSAEVEGSGDIRWRGNARIQSSAVHGSGTISHEP